MSQSNFHDTLRDLREMIAQMDKVPEEDQELLKGLSKDIDHFLGNQDDEQDHEGLGERLEEVLIQVKENHPLLTGLIERTIKALGDIGI